MDECEQVSTLNEIIAEKNKLLECLAELVRLKHEWDSWEQIQNRPTKKQLDKHRELWNRAWKAAFDVVTDLPPQERLELLEVLQRAALRQLVE